MFKFPLFLLFCDLITSRVTGDSIQIIPQRSNREIMVDSKSDSGISNRISKTFENILRNMNVSTANFEFTTEWPENNAVKLLINGTLDDIKGIPREDLMRCLWVIHKLHISREKQFYIWSIVKGDNQINELKRNDLEKLANLFPTISEMDLINLNVSDDDVLDFLGFGGMYRNFTNRQLGIIAYSLKLENSTQNVVQNIEFINKIKGVLCGFGETYLQLIPPNQFILINKTVWHNLWGCNTKQLRALLKIAQHPQAYGPITTWSKKIVSTLGFVLLAMNAGELQEISPESLEAVNSEVINKFRADQIKAFTKDQVKYLKNEAYSIYKSIILAETNDQSGKEQNRGIIAGVLMSVVIFLVI